MSTAVGGSRASQKRRAKKARATGAPTDAPPPQRSRVDSAPAAAPPPQVAAAGSCTATSDPHREWLIPLPTAACDEDELFDALNIALGEAEAIRGRKYRYGALLLAGDDHIPMKAGSNKTPFMRDNIHAEMSVLKGCARPAGKDMLIARLAPTRQSAGSGSLACGSDSDSGRAAVAAGPGEPAAPVKLLNARPCAQCEAKMVARGIRRCFFTVNGKSLGVLEYNP